MLKNDIKSMIESDIVKCEQSMGQIEGSQELFLQLLAKYNKLDKDFSKDIIVLGKVYTSKGFDYRKELKQIKEVLNIYLTLDEIPIHYTENVADGVNINISAKKFVNKGNMGKDNIQNVNKTTSVETSIDTTEKKSWLKRLFGRKE